MKKILVVDNERDVLFVLKERLVAEGYFVITADNGKDAIRLAKSKAPDLIILDIMMPEMDGTDVAAELREDPVAKDIPVIFLTAMFSKREEKDAERVVAGNVVLAKPFETKDLLAEIKKLL